MNLKIGDKVRTLTNGGGFLFPTGTVGTITGMTEYDYSVSDGETYWFYTEEEVELIDET